MHFRTALSICDIDKGDLKCLRLGSVALVRDHAHVPLSDAHGASETIHRLDAHRNICSASLPVRRNRLVAAPSMSVRLASR